MVMLYPHCEGPPSSHSRSSSSSLPSRSSSLISSSVWSTSASPVGELGFVAEPSAEATAGAMGGFELAASPALDEEAAEAGELGADVGEPGLESLFFLNIPMIAISLRCKELCFGMEAATLANRLIRINGQVVRKRGRGLLAQPHCRNS